MMIQPDDPRLTPVALRKQLIAAGESDESLARALRTGALARPRRGAYVDGPLWRSITDEQRYAVRSRACYLQADTEVFLSHVSALPFLDAPLWGLVLDEVHLTRCDGGAGRRESGICRHRGVVDDGDLLSAYGLHFSSPLRATLEVTTVADVESSLVVANHFLHRGDFDPAQLARRYENTIAHWPGSLKTDLVLRLCDPRIESVGESRTFYFLWKFHFPRPVPQYEVYDDGVLIAALDFAFPDQKVWIEFDGKVKYQKAVEEGDDVTAVVLREKRREERVAEISGWRCLRVTWTDLMYPQRLAARLRRLIDSMAGY